MANEEERRELTSKLTTYVSQRHGGAGSEAWKRAFSGADSDHDGRISSAELEALLEDAGVGNFLTISAWTQGVMEALDRDQSGHLTFPELEAVLVTGKAPPDSGMPPWDMIANAPRPSAPPVNDTRAPPKPASNDGTAELFLVAAALGYFGWRLLCKRR